MRPSHSQFARRVEGVADDESVGTVNHAQSFSKKRARGRAFFVGRESLGTVAAVPDDGVSNASMAMPNACRVSLSLISSLASSPSPLC